MNSSGGRRGSSPGPYEYGYGYEMVYRAAGEDGYNTHVNSRCKTYLWALLAIVATVLFYIFTMMLGDVPGLVRSVEDGVVAKVYLSRQIADLKRIVSEHTGRYEAAAVASDQAWAQLDTLRNDYKIVHQRVNDLSGRVLALNKKTTSLSSSSSSSTTTATSSPPIVTQAAAAGGRSNSVSDTAAAITSSSPQVPLEQLTRVLDAQNDLEKQHQQWLEELQTLKQEAENMTADIASETERVKKELEQHQLQLHDHRVQQEQQLEQREREKKDQEQRDSLLRQQRQQHEEAMEHELQRQRRLEKENLLLKESAAVAKAEIKTVQNETEHLQEKVTMLDEFLVMFKDMLTTAVESTKNAVTLDEFDRVMQERCPTSIHVSNNTDTSADHEDAHGANEGRGEEEGWVDSANNSTSSSSISSSIKVDDDGVGASVQVQYQQQQHQQQWRQARDKQLHEFQEQLDVLAGEALKEQVKAAVKNASLDIKLDLMAATLSAAQSAAERIATTTATEVVVEEIAKRVPNVLEVGGGGSTTSGGGGGGGDGNDEHYVDMHADDNDDQSVDKTMCMDEAIVKGLMQQELAMFAADRTGRVDYAALSTGGKVVTAMGLTSASYTSQYWKALHVQSDWLHQLGLGTADGGGPNEMISYDMKLSSCWAMEGQQGHITVQLSEPIIVTAITLQHVSKYVALDLTSAPKEFVVYGLQGIEDTEPVLLTSGTFDIEAGKDVQTFQVADDVKGVNSLTTPVRMVMLKVLSNYGNVDYTCIYRLRVHGQANREESYT